MDPASKLPQELGAVPRGAPLGVHQGEPHQGELSLPVLCTLSLRGLRLSRREPLREKKPRTLRLSLQWSLVGIEGQETLVPVFNERTEATRDTCSRSPENTAAELGPGSRPSTEVVVGSMFYTQQTLGQVGPWWGRPVLLQPQPRTSPFLSLSVAFPPLLAPGLHTHDVV